MGVNISLVGLDNFRFSDLTSSTTETSNLVLTDVITDSGYSAGSNEGKALDRALYLGEPEVPEPTISLKQFIEAFIQATADVFEARGFNHIADQLRGIQNFDRILGEIDLRIRKFDEDATTQIDAIERFLALMPGVASATGLSVDVDSSQVSESGSGSSVIDSIDNWIDNQNFFSGNQTLEGLIENLYKDLIIDSLLGFDEAQINNPSGFENGVGTVVDMLRALEARNNDTVPAVGTLDRTLYDALQSIQGNWAAVYSEIMSHSNQWSDFDSLGDFSGMNFSRLISGQNFDDWTNSGALIDTWTSNFLDTTLSSSSYTAIADAVRAQYQSDLANDSHITTFSSGAVSDTEIGGWFSPLPTSNPSDLLIEQGKYYYNSANGFMYKAVSNLTSGDVVHYDAATTYQPNQYVYYGGNLYKTTATTTGNTPTNTNFWRPVGFDEVTLWSLNADPTTQLSALTLGIEKMADQLAALLTSNYQGSFEQSASYGLGAVTHDASNYYTLQSGKTITQQGNYDPTRTYNEGDVFVYDGTEYVALTTITANNNYNSTTLYNVGDRVVHNGEIWEYVATPSEDFFVLGDALEVTNEVEYTLIDASQHDNVNDQVSAIWSDEKISFQGSNVITTDIAVDMGTSSGGFAFVLQNESNSALDGDASALGYGDLSAALAIEYYDDRIDLIGSDGFVITSSAQVVDLFNWDSTTPRQGTAMAISITPTGGDTADIEVYVGDSLVLTSNGVDLSALGGEAYYGFTAVNAAPPPVVAPEEPDLSLTGQAVVSIRMEDTFSVASPPQVLSETLFRPPVTPSASETTTWNEVTDSVVGDINNFLIYSGPLSEFWDYDADYSGEINALRANLAFALEDLNSGFGSPPGSLSDISNTIAGSIALVDAQLNYYSSMVDTMKNLINDVSDLTSAETMVTGILEEMKPAVEGAIGSLSTAPNNIPAWISAFDNVHPDSSFKDLATDFSTLLGHLQVIYDAYVGGGAATSTQIQTASDFAESLRAEGTGNLTSNFENYKGQWEELQDEFTLLFPPSGNSELNVSGTLQAQSIGALVDLAGQVTDLGNMSSGGGDPLYVDVYFAMKNTFETLLSNLNFRYDSSGQQLSRVVPVPGGAGNNQVDENGYFDAFRRIFVNGHSVPNSSAPLSVLYEYYDAIGNTTQANHYLQLMIEGGSEAGTSSAPGLIAQLKEEFKELSDGIQMPSESSRNVCTTNGNKQTYIASGAVENIRDLYNNAKNDIARIMNEIDTALTRETIGDTSSSRFVSESDLASYQTSAGNASGGISGFSTDHNNWNVGEDLSQFSNYGGKYHASIATAATDLMSILSNFEFFFNGDMESDAGIWGSKTSVDAAPYKFLSHGKLNGRMQEQAYVFNYGNVMSKAKSDLGAKYDSKATWIMKDLLSMIERGYSQTKDYLKDELANRVDNYWVEFNAYHLAVETEARRLVSSAFSTTTPMEDIFYSVFEADDLTAEEKRLLSKVLNMLMTLLIAMLGSNTEIREAVQSLQRGESTLAQISESITITERLARNMIERAMAMAADMIDRESESHGNSGNLLGSDPISTQQYIDMASFYQSSLKMNELLESSNQEEEALEV